MRPVSIAAAAALAALVSTAADASVVYSYDDTIHGRSWQLTTSDFITSTTSFTAAQLDSCSPASGFPCSKIDFDIQAAGPNIDEILIFWDMGNGGFLVAGDFFQTGSLGAVGTYKFSYSVGTLTVSQPTSGVPEPATWAMMVLGFSAMAFAIRRSRSVLRVASIPVYRTPAFPPVRTFSRPTGQDGTG